MTIQYTLDESDFLNFQLFTASQSKRINKKKRNGHLLLPIGAVIGAFIFFQKENISMTLYFIVVAILVGLYYPKYFIWRYKKHYRSHINEVYSNRFGLTEILTLRDTELIVSNKTGESKIHTNEIEKIDETSDHFFLKISNGNSLIIPKRELNKQMDFKNKLKEIGFSIIDRTGWSWKESLPFLLKNN